MHRLISILVGIAGLLVSAVVTFLTYGILWGAVWISTATFVSRNHASMVATIFTAVTMVAAVVAIRRQSLRGITNLDWDSGSTEDAPSRTSFPGNGGVFWNVNPLGPRSLSSISSIAASILCLGPGIAMATIVGITQNSGIPASPGPVASDQSDHATRE